MTFIDLLKDLIDSGKERIKSPITSTFFIFFAIHNWRPIALLFFSDKSIESKIVEINYIYCGYGAFLLPLLYTALYLLMLPFASAFLEQILFWPASNRRKTKNKEEIDIVNNKILLAGAELKLQDKLSRNQEIQQLVEKISELEAKNKADSDAHSALSKNYNNQLQALTENLNRANDKLKLDKHGSYFDYGTIIFESMLDAHPLTRVEINSLAELIPNTEVPITTLQSNSIMKFLKEFVLVEKRGKSTHLTQSGLGFINYLKNRYDVKN
jgi:hypothetical protein